MSAHLLKEKGGSENSSTRLKLRKDEANTLWATDACENHLFPRRPCYSVTMRTIDKSNIRKKISPSVGLPSTQTGISSQAASIISGKLTDAHLFLNSSCIHCDSAICIYNRRSPEWKHALILTVCYMISLSELEEK